MKKLLLLTAIVLSSFSSFAQGTAFTYQGRLNDGANPANGTYDLTFTLFSVSSGSGAGALVGGPLTNSPVNVSNGLFTVTLDFGANAFTGPARWLEIGVRTNGGGGFNPLTPRQPVTPTPYAIYAESASGSQLTGNIRSSNLGGNYNNALTFTNANNNFGGNGGGLTNVNAAKLGGLPVASFWQTSGNAGTVPGANVLGTTDDQPLEFWVNGVRALKLLPTTNGAPNLIGGAGGNVVDAGVVGATIAGGGTPNYEGFSRINYVRGSYGSIGGGIGNTASNIFSTVAGGFRNMASGPYATVAGGYSNTASGYAATALGNSSTASGFGSTAAGYLSTASGQYATALGQSIARNVFSTALGQSDASDLYCTALGHSTATNNSATAMGHSIASGDYSTAMGESEASGNSSTATGFSIASGHSSTAMGYSTVSGNYSTAMGYSTVSGNFSFAGGYLAFADHIGSFIWCDSLQQAGHSQGSNTFTVRASGGVYLFTSAGATGVQVGAGGGSWSSISDRNVKENFQTVNAQDMLARVTAMPLSTWNYKSQDKTIRHIGPMAQDFAAAFGVGEDDKHITTVDADGVALAAIQGLNEKVEGRSQRAEDRSRRLEQKLEETRAENAELKQRLEVLEKIVQDKISN